MENSRQTLEQRVAGRWRADPTRWLMKGRSPLLRWRVAVEILGWPREEAAAASWWRRRYQDVELRSIVAAQWPDGLWYDDHAFYRRRRTLYAPMYRGALWQLPILADLGVTLVEPAVDAAAAAFLTRLTADGFFDLGGGGPFVLGNALAIRALADWGVEAGGLKAARLWLAAQARWDGGFADADEVLTADAPSVVGTTATAAWALAGEPVVAEVCAGARRNLIRNFFSPYAGRFSPSARPWRALSWPQFRYDALYVARALRAAGASRRELRPLAEAVASLQHRRGFWRQGAALGKEFWFVPVEAGRASRWVTFFAAQFLQWYYGGKNDCDDSPNLL